MGKSKWPRLHHVANLWRCGRCGLGDAGKVALRCQTRGVHVFDGRHSKSPCSPRCAKDNQHLHHFASFCIILHHLRKICYVWPNVWPNVWLRLVVLSVCIHPQEIRNLPWPSSRASIPTPMRQDGLVSNRTTSPLSYLRFI